MELLTLKEASEWASNHLRKDVTTSNISYLIQYGKVEKHIDKNKVSVSKEDLINYYKSFTGRREVDWREKLGDDLNWALSFDHLREKDTTKHVHRLHPYKGKFIPQLVEYFIDNHTDNFKKEVYFKEGDIILDPFCGSGTTIVQANELGIHAIGTDVSSFNSLISNVKVGRVNFSKLNGEITRITNNLKAFISKNNNILFEEELLKELNIFNKAYFPSPEYKVKVRKKEIIEKEYVPEKERTFNETFEKLIKKYNITLKQDNNNNFLEKWYLKTIRDEIDFTFNQLNKIEDETIKNIITVILSRTIRSCRATTHADLATLKYPVTCPYYCRKHSKICKPLFSMFSWWDRYSKDTVKRLYEFNNLRTDTHQVCLQGDSRNINIFSELEKVNPEFAEITRSKKIKGIFSSPPYVGLIDYHEQHAYAYDLFGFKRNDELEIGPLFKGQGKDARNSYIEGISEVLLNSKNYLQKDYDIFLVANDKYNIYQDIAKKSGMKIVNQYKRPVLNRTEKDKSAYSEIIFHLKEDIDGTNQETN